MPIWIDVDTAVEVFVNALPLIDDTDFKSRETGIVYNEPGMDLVWNFLTSAGVVSQTAVTPTTGGGDYDWGNVGDAMYKIGIPASGGASINNNAEGYGWFSGICSGVLAWVSPIYGFRAAGLNDKLCDSAYEATRGLAGTALPAAAADAAGGLPISDNGQLDLDNLGADTDTLLTRLSAARAGYLDNLNGHIAQTGDSYPIVSHASYGNAQLVRSSTPANTLDVDASGRIDVGSWLGTAVTVSATSTKPEVDAYSLSDDATAAANIEADYDGTGYAKANSTIGTCTTNTDMRGTDNAALASVCTAARLGELDAANLPADVDAILADTAEIGAAGAGLTAIPWNTAWDAQVESECNDALVALALDHLVAVADNDDVANNSIIAKLATTSGDWSNFGATDALQSLDSDLDSLITTCGSIQATVLTNGVAIADDEISSAKFDESTAYPTTPVYHAAVYLTVDEANTQDEYTVQWFKDGAALSSGVTSPTIRVIKRVDGTDLIAATAMSTIGGAGSGTLKYDEGTNRLTAGEAAIVEVVATIDGGSRTWRELVGRDSEAP